MTTEQGGYTVDDLFTLPELPPHTELLDGSLVFASPQQIFHSTMVDLLVTGIRRATPPKLKVRRDMTVVLDRHNGPEPDISIIRAEIELGPDETLYRTADVLLAVEVVSPDSEARDRDTKPQKYAAAGIPNFWLVEMAGTDRHAVVRVYELDPVSKTYALTGIHHDRLKTGVPFRIDIDITRDALNQL
ncbi:Uma2 family endonuclease [Streptomyces atratus]|uniref:Uma2 family endonuclease n=1 Tax=Streptomyces atratus TaxID=1893 RepID=UPI002AC35184|nr:Uma2 family endonuclease [Streptomyces atratus]WPW29376.1 Uma2 family endonuclease [Streptomyces atratus]